MCPRHGRLLYGDSCVGCDCGGPSRPPRPFLRPALDEIRIEHIDLGSMGRFSEQMNEAIRAHAKTARERLDEEILRTYRWNPAMDERVRQGHAWGAPPNSNPIEVITDPNDLRGLDARPARVPA